jgi:hypothetical protein
MQAHYFEERPMDIEAAIKNLQDSMIVISEIERRQSDLLLTHSKWIAEHDSEIKEYRRRTDQNLTEITDKLNGLIGFVAGHKPSPPQ